MSIIDKEGCKIMKKLKILVVMLGVLCFSSTAFSGWQIFKQAQLRSQDKNYLRIEADNYEQNRKVKVWFILNVKTTGVFASKPPLYQVDDGQVHELDSANDRVIEKKDDRWVRWQIWDGKGAVSPDLLEFINGKSVVFQYYLPDGEIKETTFSLEGVKEVIEDFVR